MKQHEDKIKIPWKETKNNMRQHGKKMQRNKDNMKRQLTWKKAKGRKYENREWNENEKRNEANWRENEQEMKRSEVKPKRKWTDNEEKMKNEWRESE